VKQDGSIRAASIVGFVLIFVGIISLAYFASPIRFMIQDIGGQHKINPVPPILGGLALVVGIALMCAARPRKTKGKRDP
jgi:hypothetical protein